MRKAKLLKSGAISEDSIQDVVMQFIATSPLLRNVVIHIPNEGARTIQYGRRLKEMGMRAGVSDLFIALARRGYHGAWLELKSQDGLISAKQQQFLDDMAAQGYYTCVCFSIDETIEKIKWYAFGRNHDLSNFNLFPITCTGKP